MHLSVAPSKTVSETDLPALELVARGKVRDVYRVDETRLLFIATDRISAFDCVLPTAIPRKGEVLTQLSRFWFTRFQTLVPNHLITTEIAEMPSVVHPFAESLHGRAMLVRAAKVFPIECVVRGYLAGSGWKDYVTTGAVCGHSLPEGLREADELPAPIFTPATKAATGHDINISEAEAAQIIGADNLAFLRETSLKLYAAARDYAATRGIIIADTKFEFGLDEHGSIILVDEVLTPDSSRFWDAETYAPGSAPQSFDKQFVRDYLETLRWDKRPPAPPLPQQIVSATTARYLAAYRLLTGEELHQKLER